MDWYERELLPLDNNAVLIAINCAAPTNMIAHINNIPRTDSMSAVDNFYRTNRCGFIWRRRFNARSVPMTTIVLLLVVVDSDLLSSMAIRNSNYIKYGYMIGLLVYEYCSTMIIDF